MLCGTDKKKIMDRLSRIEGQVAAVGRMIDDGRYCVDVLAQISAAEAALGQVGKIVLGNHIETCVAGTLESGDPEARREKIDELMKIFTRYGRLARRA